MTSTDSHIIQRVRLEVGRSQQAGSFELQQNLSAWFWQEAQPILEDAFSEWGPSDQWAQLEQLELDLGQVPEQQLWSQLAPLLREALRKALRIQFQELHEAETSETNVRIESEEGRRFRHWLHWLEKGYRPASAAQLPATSDSWDDICAQVAAQASAAASLGRLLRHANPARRRLVQHYSPTELALLLSALSAENHRPLPKAWSSLGKWLAQSASKSESTGLTSPEPAPNTTAAGADSPQKPAQSAPSFGSSQWVEAVWLFTLNHYLATPSAAWVERITAWLQQSSNVCDWVLQQPKKKWPSVLHPVRRQLLKTTKRASLPKKNITPTPTPAKSDTTKVPPPSSVTDEQPSKKEHPRVESTPVDPSIGKLPVDEQAQPTTTKESPATNAQEDQQASPSPATDSREVHANDMTDREEETRTPKLAAAKRLPPTTPPVAVPASFEVPEGECFYFQGAGVVLVHPFLPTLFKTLEYWNDTQFREDEAWQEAVHLVYYIANGRVAEQEEDLILAKLLCGRPFAEPARVGIALPDTARNEADDMLRAIIKHWQAIGNASPEGLREGFFQREAKLEKKAKGWQLTIERKAQDLLLGKLPWGLSLVKLPWLKEMIYVTW